MSYTQLTLENRIEIYSLLQRGFTEERIALKLKRHRSTIYRELKRNSPYQDYRPDVAQQLSQGRRTARGVQAKFRPEIIAWIESGIRKKWSPDQVRGRLFLETGLWVSTEWIYSWILKDKKKGGTLWTHLRRASRKRRKRYGKADRRAGPIKDRESIEKRPEIIETRSRIGDLEGDTVVGKNHKGNIITLVDRTSLKASLALLRERKESHRCAGSIIQSVKRFGGKIHSLTFDNGPEFAAHKWIKSRTGADVYFAHAYCAYERGTNENLNGLLRQYLPKKTDFSCLTDEAVKKIENALNNRPRKTLCYLTPNEFHRHMATQTGGSMK